jgi:hypothetical protein
MNFANYASVLNQLINAVKETPARHSRSRLFRSSFLRFFLLYYLVLLFKAQLNDFSVLIRMNILLKGKTSEDK